MLNDQRNEQSWEEFHAGGVAWLTNVWSEDQGAKTKKEENHGGTNVVVMVTLRERVHEVATTLDVAGRKVTRRGESSNRARHKGKRLVWFGDFLAQIFSRKFLSSVM